MVLAPKWETAPTVKWYASGFSLSFTDFGLNNRLHININYLPSPQNTVKNLMTFYKSRHTVLGTSI